MSYLLDRKQKKKKAFSGLIIGGILVLIFIFRVQFFYGLSNVSHVVLRPFWSVENSLSTKFRNLSAYFSSKNSLNQKIQDLEAERALDQARMEGVVTILDENEKLKEILGRKNEKLNLTLAVILGKPDQSLYDTLIIDLGGNQGVKVGDMVYALGNIPLGRVALVYDNSAKVVLFSNSSERTQVFVKGTSLELVGRGGGNFEMILPRDVAMEKGEQAVLPGITPYVVAEVETVISDPRDSFQKVLFTSPVNIDEIKFVEVAK